MIQYINYFSYTSYQHVKFSKSGVGKIVSLSSLLKSALKGQLEHADITILGQYARAHRNYKVLVYTHVEWSFKATIAGHVGKAAGLQTYTAKLQTCLQER